MSTKMEYSGKDVTEAIKNACTQLNVLQEQLQIEIKSVGSTGIFGLCRQKAKILVSLKEETPPPKKRPRRPEPAAPASRPAPAPVSAAPATAAPATAAPAPAVTTEETAKDLTELMADAQGQLSRLLELMGAPSRVEALQEENKIVLRIAGDHLDVIIGPEGQTLDNLQYLLRKMLAKKLPSQMSISLDAGNYRETRTRELAEQALKLAQEVKESGRTRSIPALNPAERRIVHMALQDDTAIRSRSVGEGLFKKVLIYLPGKGRKRSPRSGKNRAAE